MACCCEWMRVLSLKHFRFYLLPGRIPIRRVDLQLRGVEQLHTPSIPQAKPHVRPVYAFSRYPYKCRNRCHIFDLLIRGASLKICTTVAPHNKIPCNITQSYRDLQIIDYLCDISIILRFSAYSEHPKNCGFQILSWARGRKPKRKRLRNIRGRFCIYLSLSLRINFQFCGMFIRRVACLSLRDDFSIVGMATFVA